ncbi:lytic transglycosylase domain-containing protein [Geoalkalibacter sp.]|uniref:lytic transglycosylase domain-containing protein n=1 Tax=Geoalkalibacter sp. TaxID=3041440 RepID=UPI00272E309B|nr:lytic transglycosylase domain-containing protein [Geoalkalibacter sp.]
MAINPLNQLREALLSQSTTDPARTENSSRDFAGLLDRTLGAKAPLNGEQARSLAALMKLEMMAGLVSWDDESPKSSAALAQFAALPALPRPTLVNAEQVRQKFTLMSENRLAPVRPVSLLNANNISEAGSLEQIVDKAAQRYQIAPELIKAVIKAESSFNPKAVSPAGAQGLMQLMPATARELGVDNPFDPEQNVMGGTRYLRDLLNRYDGDLDKALAAYNWGMGNLARSNGRLPEETRNYQVRVKQYLAEFNGQRTA